MPLPSYVDARDALFRHKSWTFGSLSSILGKVRARIERLVTWEISHLEGEATPALEGLDHIDSRIVLEFLDAQAIVPINTTPANLVLDYYYSDGTFGAETVIGKCVAGSLTQVQARRMGGFSNAQIFEQVGPETFTVTA